MSDESVKETVTRINPKGRYVFQFPEGTPQEEKDLFQRNLEEAAKENRNLYVEPSVKVFTVEEIERLEIAAKKEEPKVEEPKQVEPQKTEVPPPQQPPLPPVPNVAPGYPLPPPPQPIWNGYGWSYTQYPYGNPQAVYTVPGTTPSVPTQPAQAEGPIPPKKE